MFVFRIGYGQSTAESASRLHSLMTDLYQDTILQKMIEETIAECPSKYNDSNLIGKFSLCLSKGGKAWFNQFTDRKSRVIFYQNRQNIIRDFDLYFDREIRTLDYDSVEFNYEDNEDVSLFDGRLCEVYDIEQYTFYRSNVCIKKISIGFKGGKEFAFYYDDLYKKPRKEFWKITASGELYLWYE